MSVHDPHRILPIRLPHQPFNNQILESSDPNSSPPPIPLSTSQAAYVGYIDNFLTNDEQESLLKECEVILTPDESKCHYRTDCYGKQDRATAYFGDDNCDFNFCNLTLYPDEWPSECLKIRQKLDAAIKDWVSREAIDCFGDQVCNKKNIPRLDKDLSSTACLLNHYKEDKDFIPWHCDDVRAHGPAKLVVSLTLKGVRPLVLRRLRKKDHFTTNDDVGGNKSSSSTGDVEGLEIKGKETCPIAEFEKNIANEETPSEKFIFLNPGSLFIMAGTAQSEVEHSLPLEYDGKTYGDERFSLTFRSIVPGFHKDQ